MTASLRITRHLLAASLLFLAGQAQATLDLAIEMNPDPVRPIRNPRPS